MVFFFVVELLLPVSGSTKSDVSPSVNFWRKSRRDFCVAINVLTIYHGKYMNFMCKSYFC